MVNNVFKIIEAYESGIITKQESDKLMMEIPVEERLKQIKEHKKKLLAPEELNDQHN